MYTYIHYVYTLFDDHDVDRSMYFKYDLNYLDP